MTKTRMHTTADDRRATFWTGVVSMGFGTAAIGTWVGAMHLRAGVPAAWWVQVCVLLLAVVALGLGLFAASLHLYVPRAGLLFAVLVAGSIAVATVKAGRAVEESVLVDRGKVVTCVASSLDVSTSTSTSTDANGVSHTTTTTSYNYRLACPGGTPDRMTTTRSEGRKGASIRVRYDPAGRLATRPDHVVAPDAARRTAWIAFAVLAGTTLGLRPLWSATTTRPGGRRPTRRR